MNIVFPTGFILLISHSLSRSGESPASVSGIPSSPARLSAIANFDDANLRRSARAAVAAAARVQRAMEILGDEIPDHLKEAGELRISHGQASLEELGSLATPPMTKDAIAGRIRRLLAMADKRAGELGIPDTEAGLSPDLLSE